MPGFYIACGEEQLEMLSIQPGAGYNVVLIGEGFLFKECPSGSLQRIICITDEGDRRVLFEGDYFSGPFGCAQNTFLIAERDGITEYGIHGEVLHSWPSRGFSASLACSGGSIFYTGETGGLGMLDILSEEHSEVSGCGELTLILLPSANEGVLIEVYDTSGRMV